MPEAKRCRRPALPALLFCLLFSPLLTPRPGVEGSRAPRNRSRDLQAPAGDKKTLLELLLKALGDSGHQAPPQHPLGADRVLARRYRGGGGGGLSPVPAVDQEPRGLAFSSSSSSSSRERAAGQPARLFSVSRHVGKKATGRRPPPPPKMSLS